MGRRKQTNPSRCDAVEECANGAEDVENEAEGGKELEAKTDNGKVTPTLDPDEVMRNRKMIETAFGCSLSSLSALQLSRILQVAIHCQWSEEMVRSVCGLQKDLWDTLVGPGLTLKTEVFKSSATKKKPRHSPYPGSEPSAKKKNGGIVNGNSIIGIARPSATPTPDSGLSTPRSTPSHLEYVHDQPSTSGFNALAALEKSVAKFQPVQQGVPPTVTFPPFAQPPKSSSSLSGGLGSLYDFVGQLPDRLNAKSNGEDASAILTCLQCGRGFGSMEHLIHHMQQTKHFASIPKLTTGVSPFSPSNMPTNLSSSMTKPQQTPSTPSKQKQKNNSEMSLEAQVKKGLKLACARCGVQPDDIERHVRLVHGVNNQVEFAKSVRLVTETETVKKEAKFPISVTSKPATPSSTLSSTVVGNMNPDMFRAYLAMMNGSSQAPPTQKSPPTPLTMSSMFATPTQATPSQKSPITPLAAPTQAPPTPLATPISRSPSNMDSAMSQMNPQQVLLAHIQANPGLFKAFVDYTGQQQQQATPLFPLAPPTQMATPTSGAQQQATNDQSPHIAKMMSLISQMQRK